VVAYYDETADVLKLINCADTSCSPPLPSPIVLDSLAGSGVGTALAILPTDEPVVAYGRQQELKLARCTSSGCFGAPVATVVLDSGIGGNRQPSMVLDGSGLPVISYTDTFNGDLKTARCLSVAAVNPCQGASLVVRTVNSGSIAGGSSIAMSFGNRPMISYRTIAGSLAIARCSSTDCSGAAQLTTLDGPATSVTRTSLEIGTGSTPTVAYFDALAGVKIAKCVDPTCSGTPSISLLDTTTVQHKPAMVIGSDGFPVVGLAGSSGLKVVSCKTGSCQ
jgi:hypothetical protein